MAARAVAVIGPGALGLLYASRLSKVVQTAAAIRLAARMKPKGVLSLQNGLIEKIAQGVTTAGAYRDGKKVVPVALGKTLLFRIRNGEIRKRPYRGLAEALAREAALVLSREGLEITASEAVIRVMDVARMTAQNRSSMLQDLLAGRKTEREHLMESR
jgi:2-dehydropantoate 2-reductase